MGPGDGGVHRTDCQYAVESHMSLMPAGDGHEEVMLDQVSLLLPGSLIIASQWLSGGGRVSEHVTAACPDSFVPPLSCLPQTVYTKSWAGAMPCFKAMLGCQGWGRQFWPAESAQGLDPLTWEMTSLKDDLNSCTSVVKRLTSCPVFLASKKAMSCLAGRYDGSR